MKLIWSIRKNSLLLLFAVFLLVSSAEAGWVPVGPFGGDVRSLQADPENSEQMYLGTRTGQIYWTKDGGRNWSRLTGLNAPSNWVVDSIAIDPMTPEVVYAAMWSLADNGGGAYKSRDRGRTWEELDGIKGQSIRAMALAPSAPQVLVAGTLAGVFRSQDGGESWQRISPAGHREIRNVESVAIDPRRPEVIYIGTWHLPWKTVDGGAHWSPIHKGMIDDSDVFSILVDTTHTQTVYATACTGIYRSDTGGEVWRKINGIPYSSRRTRSLALDPHDPQTLYAGTTEGLWRTKDGGQSWARLSHHTWVINAIVIDPRESQHFYLGTDDLGVIETDNAGTNFHAANYGFAQRQVARIVPDPADPKRFYAALHQNGPAGGVLVTQDGGATWAPESRGLDGRDVSSVLMLGDSGRMLAGTDDGIFEYSNERHAWMNESRLKTGAFEAPARGISVADLYRRNPHESIYAATSTGLLRSEDGRTWTRLPLNLPRAAAVFAVNTGGEGGKTILAATSAGLRISRDAGQRWEAVTLDGPVQVWVQKIASHPARPDVFFIGTNVGLFRSTDGGTAWEKFGHGMPLASIHGIVVAPENVSHVVVAGTGGIYQSFDGGDHYARVEDGRGIEGLPIESLAVEQSSTSAILAGSAYNGVFLLKATEPALPSVAREQNR